MADRVHLPAYAERVPSEYMRLFNMVSMQTRCFIPPETEVYPELENYPYSLFSKSLAFTRFQLLAAMPLNPNGILMNLFDLNGNGIVHGEGFAGMLREAKPFLNRLRDSGVFALPPQGVRVLCREDASATLRTGGDACGGRESGIGGMDGSCTDGIGGTVRAGDAGNGIVAGAACRNGNGGATRADGSGGAARANSGDEAACAASGGITSGNGGANGSCGNNIGGGSLDDLCPREVLFAGLLPAFGIPFAYEGGTPPAGGAVAVSGQVLRSLRETEIRALFGENFVLVDGEALMTLIDMGLGALAGARRARWMRQNTGEFTYEQSAEWDGPQPRRASACLLFCDALRVEHEAGAQIEALSWFYNARRERVCPAQAVADGRVLIFPFGSFGSPTDIPAMLFNPMRRDLLQAALSARWGREARVSAREGERGGEQTAFPMLEGAANLIPYAYRQGAEWFLYLVNAANDPAENPVLRLPRPPAQVASADAGATSAIASWAFKGCEAPFEPCGGGRWRLRLSIPPMEAVLLQWTEA
jgi:hypothetical protein